MNRKCKIALLITVAAAFFISCASTQPGGIKVRLQINQIKTEKDSQRKAAVAMEKQLVKSLKNLRGEKCNCILYYRDRDLSLSVNRHLTGSLAKLEASLFLTVRIVDGEKSRILFSTSKIIKDEKYINEAIEEISEEIDNRKAVWR